MIAVVGEALVDLVGAADGRTFTAHPGGSPANVALGLARLGVPVSLHTALGRDHFGRLVTVHLRRDGVRLPDSSYTDSPTGLAVAVLDAAGVASYDFRLGWDPAPLQLPAGAPCLHTGSLATTLAPGAAAVEDLVRRVRDEVTVSFDPNVRPALAGDRKAARERVERLVGLSHLVKVSEEDLAWLQPGEDVEALAREWLTLGPQLVVVTLGEGGALAVAARPVGPLVVAARHEGPLVVARPARKVDIVDTVGAGDAFTAGLLSWLFAGGWLDEAGSRLAGLTPAEWEAALDRAVLVAALTCARPGADPPRLDAVAAAAAIQPPP